VIDPKCVTLAFDHQISGANFGELTVLLDFWFGESSHFVAAYVPSLFTGSPSCDLFCSVTFVLSLFLAPPTFWGCSFFIGGLSFFSPLHFGVASSFNGGLYFLTPYILGLPLSSSKFFLF
jgi:hypothetical protein